MRFIRNIIASVFLASIGLFMVACSGDTQENNTLASQTNLINSYLKTNKLQDSVTIDGSLYYYRFKKGTGAKIEKGDKVTISYVLGYIASSTNMKIFATNIKSVAKLNMLDTTGTFEPLTVVVGSSGLFKGFDDGLRYLFEGDGALILMPSTYAYGGSGIGVVPGNTPVGVRVYVLKVEK